MEAIVNGLLAAGTGTRGGGATRRIWGDESQVDGKFKSRLLAPARLPDMENSAVLGLEDDVPEIAPIGESGGLVDVERATGETAWRRRLSPRHREAVQEFFSHKQGD